MSKYSKTPILEYQQMYSKIGVIYEVKISVRSKSIPKSGFYSTYVDEIPSLPRIMYDKIQRGYSHFHKWTLKCFLICYRFSVVSVSLLMDRKAQISVCLILNTAQPDELCCCGHNLAYVLRCSILYKLGWIIWLLQFLTAWPVLGIYL